MSINKLTSSVLMVLLSLSTKAIGQDTSDINLDDHFREQAKAFEPFSYPYLEFEGDLIEGDVGVVPPSEKVELLQRLTLTSGLILVSVRIASSGNLGTFNGFAIDRVSSNATFKTEKRGPFFIEGIDLSKKSDVAAIKLEEPLKVIGTYEYATKDGVIKTIPALTTTKLQMLPQSPATIGLSPREWSTIAGENLFGTYAGYTSGNVAIQAADGSSKTVELASVSKTDGDYVRAILQADREYAKATRKRKR